MQVAWPILEYFPATHPKHTVLLPAVGWCWPAGQLVQLCGWVLPDTPYVPAWHSVPVQVLASVAAMAAENLPAVQSMQVLAVAAADHLPAAQSVQVLAAATDHSPAEQSMQVLAATADHLPPLQSVQVLAAATDHLPAAQSAQVLATVAAMAAEDLTGAGSNSRPLANRAGYAGTGSCGSHGSREPACRAISAGVGSNIRPLASRAASTSRL